MQILAKGDNVKNETCIQHFGLPRLELGTDT